MHLNKPENVFLVVIIHAWSVYLALDYKRKAGKMENKILYMNVYIFLT